MGPLINGSLFINTRAVYIFVELTKKVRSMSEILHSFSSVICPCVAKYSDVLCKLILHTKSAMTKRKYRILYNKM